MSGIIVVHEFGMPTQARTANGPGHGAGASVRRVHAAPAAPGTADEPGPRTLCGKDTFAMRAAGPRLPTGQAGPAEPAGQTTQSGRPAGSPWYPPEEAALVCPSCDAAMEDD
ncbi:MULTISPECIES: hypothetical protein [unclassified Streptomyces]|uniref:hypothetical protein n=1 Tax=unclassified Streptomyces TaxID=2593676 RepID=UPI002E0EECBE|nr:MULTISPECIES: hypothetical protein [unclassified Streptomyces]WSR23025.1 hypothetical protein OG573_30455 [Streptomyces sp. NBC_01205]